MQCRESILLVKYSITVTQVFLTVNQDHITFYPESVVKFTGSGVLRSNGEEVAADVV